MGKWVCEIREDFLAHRERRIRSKTLALVLQGIVLPEKAGEIPHQCIEHPS